MRTISSLIVLVCTLAFCSAVPTVAFADPSDLPCPSSCTCWSDAGITNMACQTNTTTAPAVLDGKDGEGAVEQIGRFAPSVDEAPEDKWLTTDERQTQLEDRQRKLDRELLEVQRNRFEARARGEDEAELERLEQTFSDLQRHRRSNVARLRSLKTD